MLTYISFSTQEKIFRKISSRITCAVKAAKFQVYSQHPVMVSVFLLVRYELCVSFLAY